MTIYYNCIGSVVVLLEIEVFSRNQLEEFYEHFYEPHYKKILDTINSKFNKDLSDTDWISLLAINDRGEDIYEWDKLYIGNEVEIDAIVDSYFIFCSLSIAERNLSNLNFLKATAESILNLKNLVYEVSELKKPSSFRTLKRSIDTCTNIFKKWDIEKTTQNIENLLKEEISSYTLYLQLKESDNASTLNSILFIFAVLGIAELKDFFIDQIGKENTNVLLTFVFYIASLSILLVSIKYIVKKCYPKNLNMIKPTVTIPNKNHEKEEIVRKKAA